MTLYKRKPETVGIITFEELEEIEIEESIHGRSGSFGGFHYKDCYFTRVSKDLFVFSGMFSYFGRNQVLVFKQNQPPIAIDKVEFYKKYEKVSG